MCSDGKYIPMGEAARELKVTKARISQLITAGKLTGMLVGGRRMIAVDSLARYKQAGGSRSTRKRAERYTLMSADYTIARVEFDAQREAPLTVQEVLDEARMPFGTVGSTGSVRLRALNDWWLHRSVPNTRPGMLAKLEDLGLSSTHSLPMRNLGLSLSDCYWLQPEGRDDLSWADINYFDNDFEGSGLHGRDEWLGAVGLDSPDNTSEGELPKRWAIRNGQRVLIKGCATDDQRPFNEVVASALHRRLLQPGAYVPYELVKVQGEPACVCPDFLASREEYIPAAYVKESLGATRGLSTYDRLVRYVGRWLCDEEAVRESLSRMIVCDALVANTDRHWRNFGFIRSVDTLEVRPAPLFDSGNSLWYAKSAAEVERGDWTFASRPFDFNPERQLALADRLDWFDEAALKGFVDEAIELLSQSASATQDGRLDYVAQGLRARVGAVAAAVRTLKNVVR